MTDTDNGGPAASDNGQEQAAPSVNVLGQYLKDLSFENPNAPQSLAPRDDAPPLKINVNVDARNLAEQDYEVVLRLEAKAGNEDDLMFHVEIDYAGVFRIANFPENQRQAFVLIECPRLLFPFARQIIAEATRNGGFPPLSLDPIDFAALYQQNMAATAEADGKLPN